MDATDVLERVQKLGDRQQVFAETFVTTLNLFTRAARELREHDPIGARILEHGFSERVPLQRLIDLL